MIAGGLFIGMILLTLAANVNQLGKKQTDADLGLETIHQYKGKKVSSDLYSTVALFDNQTKVVIPDALLEPSDTITFVDLTTKKTQTLTFPSPEKKYFARFEPYADFVFVHFYIAEGKSGYVYRVDRDGSFKQLHLVKGYESPASVTETIQKEKNNYSFKLTKIPLPNAVERTDGAGFFNEEYYVNCGFKTGYVNRCSTYPELLPFVSGEMSPEHLTVNDSLTMNGARITIERAQPDKPVDEKESYFNWIKTVKVEKNGQIKEYPLKGQYATVLQINGDLMLVGNSVRVIPLE